jgi:uncharacterized protein with ParB-like and HNH nuclease domain
MKAVSSKLVTILRDIKVNTFVVPRFQRDFVWNTKATCKLIDSIARDCPIGALLALPAEALSPPCTEMKTDIARVIGKLTTIVHVALIGEQQ